jgi:flagellar hook assembly protein FlgD
MRDPSKNYFTSVVQYSLVNGIANVTIIDDAIYQFVIMHDWTSSVQDIGENASATRIVSVSPNPISDNNEVKFELLQASQVNLQVVDLLGNVIATIANDQLSSGQYSVVWDGKDASGMKLTSGEYMIRLVAGNATSVYPVVVVK